MLCAIWYNYLEVMVVLHLVPRFLSAELLSRGKQPGHFKSSCPTTTEIRLLASKSIFFPLENILKVVQSTSVDCHRDRVSNGFPHTPFTTFGSVATRSTETSYRDIRYQVSAFGRAITIPRVRECETDFHCLLRSVG